MTGMQATVDRICYALQHNEPIAIYGDYDVDGVTATALLVQSLGALGANVRGYIPNRFDEGYGLNKDALDTLKADGVKLVITVDCGIRSPDEALHAQTIGLDLIISDHHHPDGANLPPAFAVINPKQHGDIYPDKDLAGVELLTRSQRHCSPFNSPVNGFQSKTCSTWWHLARWQTSLHWSVKTGCSSGEVCGRSAKRSDRDSSRWPVSPT
jgi:hypothetical protein